jgi:hypothetical protein
MSATTHGSGGTAESPGWSRMELSPSWNWHTSLLLPVDRNGHRWPVEIHDGKLIGLKYRVREAAPAHDQDEGDDCGIHARRSDIGFRILGLDRQLRHCIVPPGYITKR